MKKVKAKDLKIGDTLQLFKNGSPISYPFFVKTFETHENDKCFFRLESGLGNVKNYQFIDGNYELTAWHPSPHRQEYCEKCGQPV